MPDFSRRSLLAGSASLIAAASGVMTDALAQSSVITAYKTFDNKSVELRAYQGRNVALLLSPKRITEREVVDRILSAVDDAWDWYREFFGRAPTPSRAYAGKATIAEAIGGTCGAACGLLGHTGIEMSGDTLDRLLMEAHGDRYNQAVFYELGRNFWFFADPLQAMPGGAFTTRFAHVHRFYAMEVKNIVGAPWDDNLDFEKYRHAILVDLMDRYLADKTLTWENTLAVGKLPKTPHNWMTVPHLAAAFYHRIRRDHGFAGYRRFWQVMAKAPKATTPREAAANFVRVAHAATGQDYRDLLRDPSLPL
jgi:hypothetical protein